MLLFARPIFRFIKFYSILWRLGLAREKKEERENVFRAQIIPLLRTGKRFFPGVGAFSIINAICISAESGELERTENCSMLEICLS
jgi:hypothetical protein